ncbi:hypothetical protein OC834_005425 [Tilletia horrida]|nr:hypothetical protein OC834_005425 [Tilletia horrida]
MPTSHLASPSIALLRRLVALRSSTLQEPPTRFPAPFNPLGLVWLAPGFSHDHPEWMCPAVETTFQRRVRLFFEWLQAHTSDTSMRALDRGELEHLLRLIIEHGASTLLDVDEEMEWTIEDGQFPTASESTSDRGGDPARSSTSLTFGPQNLRSPEQLPGPPPTSTGANGPQSEAAIAVRDESHDGTSE